MTEGVRKSQLLWRGIAAAALARNRCACFPGCLTVFALVVTLAEAWQEHGWTQRPEVMARTLTDVGLDQARTDRREKLHPLLLELRGRR